VKEETIEVRRVVYARRDLGALMGHEHISGDVVTDISKRLIKENSEAYDALAE
jgi:hypothetical protein